MEVWAVSAILLKREAFQNIPSCTCGGVRASWSKISQLTPLYHICVYVSTNLFLFRGAKKLDFNLYCPTIYVPPKYKRGFRNEGESKKQAKKGKATLLMYFKG